MTSQRYLRSINQVRKLIEPAVPDFMVEVGTNIYEARWWMPVPIMDIEILKLTPGIVLCGEPYELTHLSNRIAVRFSLIPIRIEDGA